MQQKLQALLKQGSRQVQLQLFWEPEAGDGFTKATTQRRSVMVERVCVRVMYPLSTGAERPHQLRLDLADEPAMVWVLAIRLLSKEGPPLWQCPKLETVATVAKIG